MGVFCAFMGVEFLSPHPDRKSLIFFITIRHKTSLPLWLVKPKKVY